MNLGSIDTTEASACNYICALILESKFVTHPSKCQVSFAACMAMSGQNAHCQPEEACNTSTIDTTVCI